ncbi:MAG: hypothetical protein RLZZ299_1846 [Pseudomonadota bacterium]|jgi:hypothetical protein
MAWFDRQVGDGGVDAAMSALDAAVERSGLLAALEAVSGPHGLRRFVVRFEVRGAGVKLLGVDSAQLPRGGGPPAWFDAHARDVEQSLVALRRALPAPWTFREGAVGFVRGSDPRRSLVLRFDEDSAGFGLAELPMPTGEPWPPEDPAYVRAAAAWDGRIAPVRAAWSVAEADEDWSIAEGRLERPGRPPVPVLVLAVLDGEGFAWHLDTPAGDEAPFCEPELQVPYATAIELAMFAAARLGCVGGFQGVDTTGALVLAGVRA